MNITRLVEKAFQDNEIFSLIVGEKGYGVVPKHSPSPYKTDISLVYRGMCNYVDEVSDKGCVRNLQEELERLADCKEAVEPIASLLIMESDISKTKRLGLDLEKLNDSLKKGLRKNYDALKNDKTGMGRNYENGKIGNLERLDRLFWSRSGLSFVKD